MKPTNINTCMKERKIMKITSEYKGHFGVAVNVVKSYQPQENAFVNGRAGVGEWNGTICTRYGSLLTNCMSFQELNMLFDHFCFTFVFDLSLINLIHCLAVYYEKISCITENEKSSTACLLTNSVNYELQPPLLQSFSNAESVRVIMLYSTVFLSLNYYDI